LLHTSEQYPVEIGRNYRLHTHCDSGVISLYHSLSMPTVFRHDVGQALRNVYYCDTTFVVRQ